MKNFWKGYNKENNIDSYWLKQIPDLLKLREMILYVVLNKKLDLENINENQKNRLNRMRYNIENDIPYVDIDFT